MSDGEWQLQMVERSLVDLQIVEVHQPYAVTKRT